MSERHRVRETATTSCESKNNGERKKGHGGGIESSGNVNATTSADMQPLPIRIRRPLSPARRRHSCAAVAAAGFLAAAAEAAPCTTAVVAFGDPVDFMTEQMASVGVGADVEVRKADTCPGVSGKTLFRARWEGGSSMIK